MFAPELVERLRLELPELPADRRLRLVELGLDAHNARVLAGAEPELRQVFADAVAAGVEPGVAANWVTGELTAALRNVPEAPRSHRRRQAGRACRDGSRRASFRRRRPKKCWSRWSLRARRAAEAIAARLDVLQVSDTGAIDQAVSAVLAAQPEAVERFRAGEEKVLGFLVGMVMKQMGGRADPKLVNESLRRLLAQA